MPLYEFHCDACGADFEELIRTGTTPRCPACGSDRVRRRWSPVSAPPNLGLSGRAARESDARRGEREARRKEQFAAERKRRRGEG
jgi:putative FmdB family regulatory protein